MSNRRTECAERAELALLAYDGTQESSADINERITDLLTDLLHLGERMDFNLDNAIYKARKHFTEEKEAAATDNAPSRTKAFRVYCLGLASFSTVIEAESSEEAQRIAYESRPDWQLESAEPDRTSIEGVEEL